MMRNYRKEATWRNNMKKKTQKRKLCRFLGRSGLTGLDRPEKKRLFLPVTPGRNPMPAERPEPDDHGPDPIL